MAMKEAVLFILVIIYVVEVLGDGYGGGHSYMMPSGGGGRKWRIRARGKGMQNMMQMSYHPKKEEEKKHQEVVYYPVPVYSPKESHGGGYESSKHEVSIIPIYGGGGGMGYGHGGYGGEYGGGGYH